MKLFKISIDASDIDPFIQTIKIINEYLPFARIEINYDGMFINQKTMDNDMNVIIKIKKNKFKFFSCEDKIIFVIDTKSLLDCLIKFNKIDPLWIYCDDENDNELQLKQHMYLYDNINYYRNNIEHKLLIVIIKVIKNPKSLFEISFENLFKNSCPSEINNKLQIIFNHTPTLMEKIKYYKIRKELPFDDERLVFEIVDIYMRAIQKIEK